MDLFGVILVTIARRVKKRYGHRPTVIWGSFHLSNNRSNPFGASNQSGFNLNHLWNEKIHLPKKRFKGDFADKGTNFTETKRAHKEWVFGTNQRIYHFFSIKGIKRIFNPSAVEDYGSGRFGLWRSFKKSVCPISVKAIKEGGIKQTKMSR